MGEYSPIVLGWEKAYQNEDRLNLIGVVRKIILQTLARAARPWLAIPSF